MFLENVYGKGFATLYEAGISRKNQGSAGTKKEQVAKQIMDEYQYDGYLTLVVSDEQED